MKILILNKTVGTGSTLTSIVAKQIYNTLLNNTETTVCYSEFRGVKDLEHIVKKIDFDYILPSFQLGWSDTGVIQEFLTEKNIKYLFSETATTELCHNKDSFKQWARKNKITVPKTYTENSLIFPCIKKKKTGEDVLSVQVIDSESNFSTNYTYEEYLSKENGWEEYTVTMLNGKLMSPILIDKKNKTLHRDKDKFIYNFNEKETISNLVKSKFEDIYKKLNIKSHCTIDFMIKDGECKVLEVNTHPFLNPNGTCIKSIMYELFLPYDKILLEIIKNE